MGRKVRRSWKRQQRHHLMTLPRIVCCVDCCDSIVLNSKETEGGNDTILEAIICEETMNRDIQKSLSCFRFQIPGIIVAMKKTWRYSCQLSGVDHKNEIFHHHQSRELSCVICLMDIFHKPISWKPSELEHFRALKMSLNPGLTDPGHC